MTPVQERELTVHRALKRILASSVFARQERLCQFLRYVVEQHLAGLDQEVKESVIGTEIFGRKPDYNPKAEAIVRTEARRLRALLHEYYLGEGKGDALVIDLPKGGYVPVFRDVAVQPIPPAYAPRRRSLLAAVFLVILGIATGWWWTQSNRAPVAIAVLPLVNLSQDPANDYFTDGLTGEIIRNLSIIEGLAVRSQTSSFVFKGNPRNVREAGKQLGADYIVEGSVQRAGQRLSINAQLIRVRDDYPLWSGKMNRELTDIFAVQEEISRGIVNSLRLKLGGGRRRYETSAEAYDLYLRARSFEMLPLLAGVNKSIEPFEQAISQDPSFAPAYAGLAAAHAARSGFDLSDPAKRASEISKGWAAAEKAVQLDPLSAEAHDALGMMRATAAQWKEAEQSFRRAIELSPGDSLCRRHFAQFLLLPLGRVEEALHHLRRAENADPLSPGVQAELSAALRAAGRNEEADAQCRNAALDERQKLVCQAEILARQGKLDNVVRILEARWLDHPLEPGSASLGVAYAKAGRPGDAERVAAIVPRPLSQAIIFAAMGDKDRAFEALDRAVPLGPVRVGRDLVINHELASLREDPRLKALRRKLGLPE